MVFSNNFNSDHGYGSGTSTSSSSWMSQQDLRWPPLQPQQTMTRPTNKTSSYSDLVTGRCTLEEVMREFQMNGSDSPYPEKDHGWKMSAQPAADVLVSGLGPPSWYVRQKSWPEPERSPAAPLPPAPRSPRSPPAAPAPLATSTPVFDEVPALAPLPLPPSAPPAPAGLSPEQARVLTSLPGAVLDSLLKQLQQEKRTRTFQECRFCKNNGERESFYRGHVLKDARGRVACPVLRAFRCARCGAGGDRAHTIKYCPLSTNEERIKSAAMMRSVRMASGRRRSGPGPAPAAVSPDYDYVLFGERTPSVLQDNNYDHYGEPLDPLWAALEQKLML